MSETNDNEILISSLISNSNMELITKPILKDNLILKYNNIPNINNQTGEVSFGDILLTFKNITDKNLFKLKYGI